MRRIRPIHCAYFLIGCFLVVERRLRQGKNAASFHAGPVDRGSTRAVSSAYGMSIIGLLAAPLFNRLRVGRIVSDRFAWGGAIVALSGLLLRIWATLVLGPYYTRTLRIESGQHIITEGPYRLVRNPGYLGVILLWLGAEAAASNGVLLFLLAPPLLRAYLYRIRVEEAMLAETFGPEYRAYANRTWRLVPFVY